MPIKSSFIIFVLALFSNSIMANEKQTCISSSVAAISGIIPGIDEKALKKLNNHSSSITTTGEDDGGGYEARIYYYEKFNITTVRGKIDSIKITSPKLLWAKKIKIGTERKDVKNNIIPFPVSNNENSTQYLVCSNLGDVYAILQYHKNKVTSIQLVIDRP